MSNQRRFRRLTCVGLAALSGLLLFLADYPVHAWPLQAVALLPWLVGLLWCQPSYKIAAASGLTLGIIYVGGLELLLDFPLMLALPLAVYLSVLWALLSALARWTLSWSTRWGALFVGAAAVLVEWADFNLLAIWGTAQCFARTWSAAPPLMQLVDLTGVTGLVFTLVASQALAANVILGRERKANAVILAVLLLLVATYNVVAWQRHANDQRLRVAAIGWTTKDLELGRKTPVEQMWAKIYQPLFSKAVAQGAKLVLAPETGVFLDESTKGPFLQHLRSFARQHGVFVGAGYFDGQRNDNRLPFVSPTGKLLGEYRKTHLIATIETYTAGSGELVTAAHAGVLIGGMICQDDNFTDLARAYGRRRVALMLVPTNDWKQVKDYHLENSIFRAVENRYAIVRAATNGISAIISPRGEQLARVDHFERGPAMIVADVPLGQGGGLYSTTGEWFSWVCLLLLINGWRGRRRRPTTAD